MNAAQKEARLAEIKREMVAAHIRDDGERLRELSQEKQALKKRKFCIVCGQKTQGERCNLHEKQRRFYSRGLAFARD